MYATSEYPNFHHLPSQSPTNIEIEEVTLGGCMVDPNAIARIKDIIPAEAFYLPAHQDIYKAILALHKQNRPTDLLGVINWLTDHDLLAKIGGRNKLATLLDRTVSAVNINYHADTLVEKFLRRQLISCANKIEANAHETDKPLSWILENTENLILRITQMRKQDSKGYWQKWDKSVFERLCKDLEEIEEIENIAQRDWAMRKLAKKWKFSNKKELLDFHAKWLDSQDSAKIHSTKEYFKTYGQSEQDWLIPGFIPASSVVVLYADGGVGKTRLAFTLAKHAVTGGTFAYEGTDFEPMNTLLIETDQGPRNTAKLLEMQGFLEDDISDRLSICDNWTFGEFGRLKTMLKNNKPKLVILDSMTSLSVSSLYSENDTEYARPLIRLRHFAKEFGCTFLVIHHSNAQGGIRGTRAIKNTVDEVFKFTKQQNELGEFNVLAIEKTRSRGPANYKFTYDDDTWGWKFGGRLEDEVLGNSTNSTSIMTRCLKFFQANKGIAFEGQEVASQLGIPRESVRRELRRAAAEGLVNTGRSTRDIRALVYYLGARVINHTSGNEGKVDQIRIEEVITLPVSPDNDSGRCDHLPIENLQEIFRGSDKNDQVDDQEITSIAQEFKSNGIASTSEKTETYGDVITSGRSDVIGDVITSNEPDHHGSLVTSLNKEDLKKDANLVDKKDTCSKSNGLSVNFNINGIYRWEAKNKNVKIARIFKTKPEAEVYISGEIEKFRVALKELSVIPAAPSPAGASELMVGDEVLVLDGSTQFLKQNLGKQLKIEIIDEAGVWLRDASRKKTSPLFGPYHRRELKKCKS